MENYTIGFDVFFNSIKSSIVSKNNEIFLGSREAKLLLLFCQKPNELINKSMIYDFIWGALVVNETSLTKAVSNLRKTLLEIEGVTCEIKTVPREGYIFIFESSELDVEKNVLNKNKKSKYGFLDSIESKFNKIFGDFLLIYIVLLSSILSSITTFLMIKIIY